MLPTEEKYGTWASSSEIDIMEFKGQGPNVIWGTLHHGKQWPDNKHTGDTYKLEKGNFTDDFHTFTLEWEEGMVLNLAIRGGFVGNVDASTKFPREFLIDFVRVHQR